MLYDAARSPVQTNDRYIMSSMLCSIMLIAQDYSLDSNVISFKKYTGYWAAVNINQNFLSLFSVALPDRQSSSATLWSNAPDANSHASS